MFALWILQFGVDDPERPGKRVAQPARDLGKSRFGVVVERKIERRPGRETIEDRSELDFVVGGGESMVILLQALGGRQVERGDGDAVIRFRRRDAANEKVVELSVDEVVVPLEVLLVDIEAT